MSKAIALSIIALCLALIVQEFTIMTLRRDLADETAGWNQCVDVWKEQHGWPQK